MLVMLVCKPSCHENMMYVSKQGWYFLITNKSIFNLYFEASNDFGVLLSIVYGIKCTLNAFHHSRDSVQLR